jgi:hypothetical protein
VKKVKLVLTFIVIVLLIDFTYENLDPLQPKLFKYNLGHLPAFLLAYIGIALGWVAGWVGHMLRVRKKRRQAAALVQQQAQSQPGQEAAS